MNIILIISELLELILNYLIYQYANQLTLIQPLHKKVCKIEISELKLPIILYFDLHHIHVFNNWHKHIDCTIQTNLNIFLLFLINQKKIKFANNIHFKIHGDLATINNFIIYMRGIQSNLFDFFYPYTHHYIIITACYAVKHILKKINKKINIFTLSINFAVTDEWKLTPNLLEILWLYKNINILQSQLKLLFKRLKKLEKR